MDGVAPPKIRRILRESRRIFFVPFLQWEQSEFTTTHSAILKEKEMPFKMRNTILCSAAMSAVVVSAIFLAEIIRIANIFLLVPYFLVVAVIYTALLLSENRKTLLLKWVLVLPFSFFCFEYFWQTHYSIRALNWMIEDYGKQSAGGNFAGFLFLILLFVLCVAGILFAYSRSSEKIKRYTKAQSLVSLLLLVLVIVVVVTLEAFFPSYPDVLSNYSS